MGSDFFEALGRAVDTEWTAAGRSPERFAAVAARVLGEATPPRDLTAPAVLREAIARPRLDALGPDNFGQPPLTLFRAEDFYVSALYWLDATTAIHQHAFSGAFRVLVGSSVHCEYRFDERDAVAERLLIGDLAWDRAELLREGDTRPIVAGRSFVHSLFHLDRPTVTIVIRTMAEPVGPQFEYAPPGLAWDPFFRDDGLRRRFAAIETLWQLAPDEAVSSASELISRSDEWTGFLAVHHWFTKVGTGTALDGLVDRVTATHARLDGTLPPALDELARRFELVGRRRLIDDPGQRLFLALLLNLPDQASMTGLLAAAFPAESPHALLRGWLTALASPELRGASGFRFSDAQLEQLVAAIDPSASAATAPSKVPRALAPLFR